MLEFLLKQLCWHGWLLFGLEAAAIYNVYQAARHPQIVYALLHFLAATGYAGLALLYAGADFFAFML